MRRVSATFVVLVVLVSACSVSPHPPEESGKWFILAPDADGGFPDDLDSVATSWRLVTYTVSYGGPVIDSFLEANRSRSGLYAVIEVTAGERPTIVAADLFVLCGSLVRYEHASGPFTIGADGTFAVTTVGVQIDGELSGNERLSLSWTAGECGGAWTVTESGTADGGGFLADD